MTDNTELPIAHKYEAHVAKVITDLSNTIGSLGAFYHQLKNDRPDIKPTDLTVNDLAVSDLALSTLEELRRAREAVVEIDGILRWTPPSMDGIHRAQRKR